MCARPSVREAVLNAAESVAAEKGAAHLTLEEVALRAGLTKAGVIYHFKSKERLLQAMIERLVADCESCSSCGAASESESEKYKGMLDAMTSETKERSQLCSSLLAAAASNPKLLAPVKAHYQKFNQYRQESSSDYALSTLIFLAADGLWLQEALGLSPLTAAQRKKVLERLKVLADQLGTRKVLGKSKKSASRKK